MPPFRPWFKTYDEERQAADRQTTSLAGLAMALLLIVVGLFLVHHLHAKAAVEDCLLAGRATCPVVEVLR